MSSERSLRAWERIREQLQESQRGTVVAIPRRRGLPHPRNAGARLTSTWPVGQTADYLLDGRPPLAVREFHDRYEAFLDTAFMAGQVLRAVEEDPTKAMYVGAALVGGALGASMTSRRDGVVLGAGLGVLFAALLQSSSRKTEAR